MDVFTALGLVGLGGLLGIAGQGARAIVGIRKDWTSAAKDPRVRELAERENELHVKLTALIARERELDKKAEESSSNSQPSPTEADREKINREKEILLKEKDMVLRQRQALSWFSWSELLFSLLIALVVGGIAGILASINLPEEEITPATMLTIVAAGYAGTDFIEGFISEKLPS